MQNHNSNSWKKNKIATALLWAFFMVSFIEIIAEFNEDKLLIWITKPLILPILLFYYLKRSKNINPYFIIALSAGWVANLLFIQNTILFIQLGVFFFLIYRILVIYIVMSKVKMPNSIPLILGSIPFVFIYALVTLYTYDTLGNNVYLFLIQGIFTIFLGGFSLGNFIMISNKTNSLLLISTMFMAFNQFLFLLKFYSNDVNILQSFAMLLFVSGQFLLTKYMLHTEKIKHKYQIINNLNNNIP